MLKSNLDLSIAYKFFSLTLLVFLMLLTFGAFIIIFQLYQVKINWDIRLIQFLMQFGFILFFTVVLHYLNKYYTFTFIFIFQILFSIMLYFYYVYLLNTPLGYNPNDALEYQLVIEKYGDGNFMNLIRSLKNTPRLSSVSDWGFPIYRFLIYKLFPNKCTDLFVLVILNACFHVISSLYVFKISKIYLSDVLSNLVMFFWGASATSIYLNASGLKEPIFSFFVVLSVYHLLSYKKKFFFHFVAFVFYTGVIYFFRSYITFFLIIIFFISYPLKKIFEKFFFIFIISIFIIAFWGMEIFSYFLPELSFVKVERDLRLLRFYGSNGLIGNLMNFCFAWLTPLPKFNEFAEVKQIIFSSFSILKSFFSLFGVYGIFYVIKNKCKSFYLILTFLVCNTVLVIITCNSLDFRFGHPTSFIDFIFIVFGFEKLSNNGFKINKFKSLSINVIFLCIFVLVFILVFYYNIK